MFKYQFILSGITSKDAPQSPDFNIDTALACHSNTLTEDKKTSDEALKRMNQVYLDGDYMKFGH